MKTLYLPTLPILLAGAEIWVGVHEDLFMKAVGGSLPELPIPNVQIQGGDLLALRDIFETGDREATRALAKNILETTESDFLLTLDYAHLATFKDNANFLILKDGLALCVEQLDLPSNMTSGIPAIFFEKAMSDGFFGPADDFADGGHGHLDMCTSCELLDVPMESRLFPDIEERRFKLSCTAAASDVIPPAADAPLGAPGPQGPRGPLSDPRGGPQGGPQSGPPDDSAPRAPPVRTVQAEDIAVPVQQQPMPHEHLIQAGLPALQNPLPGLVMGGHLEGDIELTEAEEEEADTTEGEPQGYIVNILSGDTHEDRDFQSLADTMTDSLDHAGAPRSKPLELSADDDESTESEEIAKESQGMIEEAVGNVGHSIIEDQKQQMLKRAGLDNLLAEEEGESTEAEKEGQQDEEEGGEKEMQGLQDMVMENAAENMVNKKKDELVDGGLNALLGDAEEEEEATEEEVAEKDTQGLQDMVMENAAENMVNKKKDELVDGGLNALLGDAEEEEEVTEEEVAEKDTQGVEGEGLALATKIVAEEMKQGQHGEPNEGVKDTQGLGDIAEGIYQDQKNGVMERADMMASIFKGGQSEESAEETTEAEESAKDTQEDRGEPGDHNDLSEEGKAGSEETTEELDDEADFHKVTQSEAPEETSTSQEADKDSETPLHQETEEASSAQEDLVDEVPTIDEETTTEETTSTQEPTQEVPAQLKAPQGIEQEVGDNIANFITLNPNRSHLGGLFKKAKKPEEESTSAETTEEETTTEKPKKLMQVGDVASIVNIANQVGHAVGSLGLGNMADQVLQNGVDPNTVSSLVNSTVGASSNMVSSLQNMTSTATTTAVPSEEEGDTTEEETTTAAAGLVNLISNFIPQQQAPQPTTNYNTYTQPDPSQFIPNPYVNQ